MSSTAKNLFGNQFPTMGGESVNVYLLQVLDKDLLQVLDKDRPWASYPD